MNIKFEVEYIYPDNIWKWRTSNGVVHSSLEAISMLEKMNDYVSKSIKPKLREDMTRVEYNATYWNKFQRAHLTVGDRDRCYFCGDHTNKHTASRDHLWPRSKGGTVVVLSCRSCNHKKASMLPESFRMLMFGLARSEFYAESEIRKYELSK